MPIKINVPFSHKDEAKKLGAIWVPDAKTWVNTCQYCQTIQGDDYNTHNSDSPFGGYLNEKKTLFRGKEMEQIQLRFDYYIDGVMYEGRYSWDGFSEADIPPIF